MSIIQEVQLDVNQLRWKEKALKSIKKYQQGALYLATGIGKSYVAKDIINDYLKEDSNAQILWIAPASAMNNIKLNFFESYDNIIFESFENLRIKEDNIDVKYVFEDKNESTGMAFIMVNENGNNSIIVVAGSNMTINKEDIEASLEKIEESDILIAQFETSEEMTLEAFKKAKEFGKVTILNPAPAKKINEELLKVTDIIVPNETEAEVLTGITVETLEDANKAGKVFLEKGVKFVVITLGDKGAAVIGKDFCKLVPSYKVNAIDTTAAGDSFIGGLSSKLDFRNINKETLIGAVNFGNKVSSISVQRKGAQPSIPYLKEIEEIYGED